LRRAVTDPVLFVREFLEIEPHKGQVRWLTRSTRPENLLCTGNRWGKSLVQAMKIIHRCIFRIRKLKYDSSGRYTAVNASITMDQAKIIFHSVLRLMAGKSLMELMVDRVRWTPYPQLYFSNGAVFTARSTQNRGEHLLGNDYDFFNFDEAAFELHPEYVLDEVVAMRLADREGMLDLTSTPKGKNWFYRRAMELSKRPGTCYVQKGSTLENPHVSKEYVDRKIETLSDARVSQNIYGEFVDTGDEIVSEELIQRALAMSSGLSDPREGHRYCHGWDLARKVTHTVGVTLDLTSRPYQTVAIERFQGRDWDSVFAAVRNRHRAYGGQVLIDSTGLGDVVLSQLADIGAEGYNFGAGGGKAKVELLTNLQLMHERGEVAYPYFEQMDSDEVWSDIQELREATWSDNSSCDFLMALGLACWIAGRADRESSARIVRPKAEIL
jgi:hypothetical protein